MSALDDLVIVIEWLASTKTATGNVAEALERLKNRAVSDAARVPEKGDKDDGQGSKYSG